MLSQKVNMFKPIFERKNELSHIKIYSAQVIDYTLKMDEENGNMIKIIKIRFKIGKHIIHDSIFCNYKINRDSTSGT